MTQRPDPGRQGSVFASPLSTRAWGHQCAVDRQKTASWSRSSAGPARPTESGAGGIFFLSPLRWRIILAPSAGACCRLRRDIAVEDQSRKRCSFVADSRVILLARPEFFSSRAAGSHPASVSLLFVLLFFPLRHTPISTAISFSSGRAARRFSRRLFRLPQ